MCMQEIFVSQVWQTSHCLPLEDHIYTIKFADFGLREMTDVEISLSTVDIGSRSNPSAFLVSSYIYFIRFMSKSFDRANIPAH